MHNPRAALDRVEGADGLEGLMRLSDQVPCILVINDDRDERYRKYDAPSLAARGIVQAVVDVAQEYDGRFRLIGVDLQLLESRWEFLHLVRELDRKRAPLFLPCFIGLAGGVFTLLKAWSGDPGGFAPHKLRPLILSFLDEAARMGVCSQDDSQGMTNEGSPAEWVRVTRLSKSMLFVSHATEDAQAAADIVEKFTGAGVGTWLATRDIQVGDNYAAQIYDAVVESTHLLVLLSPASVASQHVQREVNLALDQGKVILPLIVSPTADFMSALPAEWKYWLGVVQVIPYSGASDAVATLLRRLEANG